MDRYIYPVLTGICLATIGIFTKLIGSAINPFSLTFFRVAIATVIIFFFLCLQRKLSVLKIGGEDYKHFIILGLLIAVDFSLYILAFSYAPVANVVLLVFVFPLVVYFLAYLFLKEKISRYALISLFIALMGILLINYKVALSGYLLGNTIALIGGCIYGVLITYLKYEGKDHSSLKVIFWSMFFATLFLLPAIILKGVGSITPIIGLWVLGIGIISTGLAYVLLSVSLKRIAAHLVSMIILLTEPLIAIILAFLILGEVVSNNVFLGGGLILIAGLLIYKEEHKKQKV